MKNMLTSVQNNMGKNYVSENVFQSDCYMQSAQSIKMLKSKAHVIKRNVLKVHIFVRRKMPCPNTVFHKDKTQVDGNFQLSIRKCIKIGSDLGDIGSEF